jgi:hypothetical protein
MIGGGGLFCHLHACLREHPELLKTRHRNAPITLRFNA